MLTPWAMRLIVANIAVYLVTIALPGLRELLGFIPALILVRPWTLLTYMFVHANLGHLLFNMLAFFFFGPRLELELGGPRFLRLYFISGIMGGLLSFLFNPMTEIVGASGAIYGVMLGFAYLWPQAPIFIWGIIPVQARWLVVGMTVLTLFGGFGGSSDGIAHFAHLGGFIGGYLYLRFTAPPGRGAGAREIRPQAAGPPAISKTDLERWRSIRRDGMHVVNREELDRIMAKMSTAGPESLTPVEREFLDRFSTP